MGWTKPISMTCTPCGAGTYASASAATHCANCQPGKYASTMSATTCTVCAADTYQNAPGATACDSCMPNSSSPVGSTDKSACLCHAGFVREAATDVCMPCAAGTYSNASEASECVDCVVGKYASATGATACVECPPRSMSEARAAACACEAGYEGLGCTACDAGKYRDLALPSCVFCEAGSYSDTQAATHCSLCLTEVREHNGLNSVCAVRRACTVRGRRESMRL